MVLILSPKQRALRFLFKVWRWTKRFLGHKTVKWYGYRRYAIVHKDWKFTIDAHTQSP